MRIPTDLYKPSLALLTDLYQLTMAQAAWRSGAARDESVFHLFFRRSPFGSGYAIAAGLEAALDWLAALRFDRDDLAFLATLKGADGGRHLSSDFLAELGRLEPALDVDAMPEGTAVFPQEPLLRVKGPVIACMLAETTLLNLVNFPTLVATKAARIVQATRGEPVLEFGLRRAQGIDGGLTASRAAYLGGCDATSNVLAGRLFGIPVKGTHAHSWVMLFDTEREAFQEYAQALPNNCVFLVDTYDTLDGVRHAIEAGRWLEERGQKLLGVRLDSGDLASLSIEARKLLDEAGFPEARIFASNDLDEHVIESLKAQGAAIAVWGVGTRLVTAADDPALGGVYKLAAVRKAGGGGTWRYRVKVSEQAAKTSTPGILQVRRFSSPGASSAFLADGIYDLERGWGLAGAATRLVNPFDPTLLTRVPGDAVGEDLLVPAMRGGKIVLEGGGLEAARARAQAQLARLPAGVKRFLNPHLYPVGLEPGLQELRTRMILEARKPSP
ncbi:MAG: nicotinate phosphoribosyltransferase [Deltaproteobacteria bacterium]|nr:nicotinate phosphoribosyltransferase [Deltaproteobacteria bacterium]